MVNASNPAVTTIAAGRYDRNDCKNDNGGIKLMKKYLVSWIDRGASNNGVFYAHKMKVLRVQTEYLVGHITSINLLEE